MPTRKSFDSEAAKAMGLRIREVRGEKTQAEFAKLIGVDRATLSNYESGRRQPNSEIIKKIADFGRMNVASLIFGSFNAPFDEYQRSVNESIAQASAENPGYIPKWYISDDEIDLIFAFRLTYNDNFRLEVIKKLVSLAQETLDHEQSIQGGLVPPYGGAHIERLQRVLESGRFKEGYDPNVQFWATLWEEPQGWHDANTPKK